MKKILLILAGIFGIFILIGIVASNTPEGKKSFEAGLEKGRETVEGNENQTVYTLEAKAEVGNDGKILVSGTSNLPNGSLLDVSVNRMVMFNGETEEKATLEGRGVEKASVWDGQFNTTVAPLDSTFSTWLASVGDEVAKVGSNVQVVVTFNPKRAQPAQKDEVLQVVGSEGENLNTSPQKKVIGDRSDNPWTQLETELVVPFPQP